MASREALAGSGQVRPAYASPSRLRDAVPDSYTFTYHLLKINMPNKPIIPAATIVQKDAGITLFDGRWGF